MFGASELRSVVDTLSLANVLAVCTWARHSHSASFHPRVQMGTGELVGQPDKMPGRVTCDVLASHTGEVATLLVASCEVMGPLC